MPELERGNSPVPGSGQDGERDEGAVPPLNLGGHGHGLDDVAYLLQGRNARRAGGFGDPRLLAERLKYSASE